MSSELFCCVCGLDINYPETFDLDEEDIAQHFDEELLPESQLEVRPIGQKPLVPKPVT